MKTKKLIVAIDDLEDNLLTVSALLKEFYPDIEVKTTTSPEKGIELVKTLLPDIIILDIYMPVMDGFMVCSKIKMNKMTQDIPVIILTASKGERDVRLRALESGADVFISKPIETSEFLAQIRAMLKISEANHFKKNENERLSILVEERTALLRKKHLQTLHLIEKLKEENKSRKSSQEALMEAQKLAKICSFEYFVENDSIHWSDEVLSLLNLPDFDEINSLSKAYSYFKIENEYLIEDIKRRLGDIKDLIQIRIKKTFSQYETRFFDTRFYISLDENNMISSLKGTMQDVTSQVLFEERLTYMGEHDFLTNQYNRPYFENKLLELDRPEFYPLSIIMADVNGLKIINDSFGHERGDEILIETAHILNSSITRNDIVARLGGDEFVMLLPRRDENEVVALIEEMKKKTYEENENFVSLSVSYGCATKRFIHEKMSFILKKAEDDMYRHKITESSSMRSKSVDLILNALFAKSPREMQHSKRVSELCESIAKHIFNNQDTINQVRIAGLLHDIGKIGIDEVILNKNGKLTTEEYNEIKKHSEIGYRILNSVSEFSELARFILEHHEKNDGTGYPNGLKNKQISIQAKIITVADSYDAMTSDRTYRKGLSMPEAIDELIRCTNTQFDQDIVKIFVEKVLNEQLKLSS